MARKLVYFNGILDASPDIILVLNLKKQILMFSKSGERILGYSESSLLRRSFSKLFKRNKETEEFMHLIDETGQVDEHQILGKTVTGALIPFSVSVRQLKDDENEFIGYVVNMHDIHRRIPLEKRLRRQFAELDSIVTNSGAMIVTTDPRGKITKINPRAEKVLGVKNREMIGRTMLDFYVDKKFRRSKVRELQKKESVEYEAKIRTATGEIRTFFVVLSNIRSPLSHKLLGRVGISHDITLRKQAEEKLLRMLITDSLTDLGNRRYFFETLKKYLNKMKKSPRQSFYLAFLDLDNFKSYNDTFGHRKGDEILKNFGGLCQKFMRGKSSPLFFRYGGDEFVALVPSGSIEKVKNLLDRLRRRFAQMTDSQITLSIGLTQYHKRDNLEKIINRADAAAYKSKALGRNRVVIDVE